MKNNLIFVVVFIFMHQAVQGSSIEYVTESYLLGRVIEKGHLQYPQIGKALIPGRVIFSIVVDGQGIVESSKIIAGHALLNESAQNYVHTWKFLPLIENGYAHKITGIVTIWYDIATENQIRGRDLPAIRVAGSDAYVVNEGTLNYGNYSPHNQTCGLNF
jgi:TonB family protein